MTTIELGKPDITIDRLIEMAKKEALMLQNATGDRFILALAPVDEFDLEVESLSKNKAFMQWLDEISARPATIPLEDVERELGLA